MSVVASFAILLGLLVCFAGIVLLFTGRYPKSLFDLVLGMTAGPIASRPMPR